MSMAHDLFRSWLGEVKDRGIWDLSADQIRALAVEQIPELREAFLFVAATDSERCSAPGAAGDVAFGDFSKRRAWELAVSWFIYQAWNRTLGA